mmetsp:Transcript_48577/g.140760  ORF Transcript_48577/g.140760 Transcript_48577/m.140760 type:complete len:137 (-) Transcript_48577:43-453(-)
MVARAAVSMRSFFQRQCFHGSARLCARVQMPRKASAHISPSRGATKSPWPRCVQLWESDVSTAQPSQTAGASWPLVSRQITQSALVWLPTILYWLAGQALPTRHEPSWHLKRALCSFGAVSHHFGGGAVDGHSFPM